MANFTNAFQPEDGINLDDLVGIFSGTADPTAGAGEAAPIGSLYLRSNGQLWQKTGSANVDWSVLAFGSAVNLVSISGTDTSTGLLDSKLVVDTTLTKTILNPGGAETLQLKIADNVVLPGTGAVTLPTGTSAQRTATVGGLRYNTDTDLSEAYINSAWQAVVTDEDLRLNPTNVLKVRKNPGKFEFSSVKTAIDSISGNSSSNRYLIDVGPGTFNEDPFTMKPWVAIVADSWQSTTLSATNANANFITVCNDALINNLTLTGATGTDCAALHFEDAVENVSTKSFVGWNLRFGANKIHARVVSSTKTTFIQLVNPTFGGSFAYDQAYVAISTGGGVARISARLSTTIGATSPEPTDLSYASGAGAELYLNNAQVRTSLSSPSGTGVRIRNGALARILGGVFRGFSKAVWVENSGAASTILGYNLVGESNTMDVVIDHPTTNGSIIGAMTKSKVSSASPNVAMLFLDPVAATASTNVIGQLNMGTTVNTSTNISPLIQETNAVGVLSGGVISAHPTLPATVVVTAGYGYLRDPTTQRAKYVSWPTSNVALTDNSPNTIYVDTSAVFHSSPADPNVFENIVVGGALSVDGVVSFIARIPFNANNAATHVDEYLRSVFGPIFSTGSIVSEGTTPFTLDVTNGVYYLSTIRFEPSGGTGITFLEFQPDGSFTTTNTVDNTQYNNSGTLTALTTGYYTKHALYVFEDGTDEAYGFVFGDAEYETLNEAHAAPMPVPPSFFVAPVVLIAALVVQEGGTSIAMIHDERPRLGFTASAATAASDHGNLSGLLDDDHVQYLLSNGTRSMSGNLDMGTNAITNVGLVDGVDVSAHAARHLPNGADPLTTGAGVSLSTSTTNTTGTSNALARSDHTHALSGVQPLDATLTALASYNTNGLLTQTAADTFTGRTLTGTARVSVSNGDGVAGNPTIDLSTIGTAGTYVSVTTDAYGRVTGGTTTQAWSTITSTPTTLSGYGITDAQSLDSDLTALAALSTTGISVRTGSGTWTTRTLTAPAQGISISNADGVAGNPTLALTNDLAGLEALASTGLAARTATDNWVVRTITGTAGNITVSNGGGVAGDPVINLATAGTAGTYRSVTTDAFGRVTVGTNPTTLAGYGITDAQPLDTDLTALAGLTTTGIVARTGAGTAVTRTLTAGTAISVSNGDGVAGNPTITNTGVTSATGTANQVIVSGATGAVTFSLPQDINTGATPTFAQVLVAADPTTALQLATKQYVDNNITGLDFKQSVRATTAGSNISLSGTQTIDGVSLIAGDRVLVKDQTTATQNGIYVVAAGAWARSADADINAEVTSGLFTFVEEGTLFGNSGWVLSTANPITVGSTSLVFVQFTGTGQITAGAGLSKTGNTIDVGTASSARIVVNADNIDLATTGTAGTYVSVTTDAYGRVSAGSSTQAWSTLTGTPTTLAGYGITNAQPLDTDLTALANIATTGLYTITASGTSATRTMQAPVAGFTIANPGGVAGNPTFALANDLAGLEGLATTGLAVRTAADTWATRSLVQGAGILITNADGISGNITIAATNTGTVTSVALTVPSFLSVAGSPVTTAGTLAVSLATQAAHTFLMGATSGTAVPTFRTASLVQGDMSDVVLASPVLNQVLAYNGTVWTNTGAVGANAAGLIGVGQSGAAAWTFLSGTRYYADFAHNLATTNVVITLFDSTTNAVVIADSTVLTNTNTVRVTVVGNTKTLRVVVVANGQSIVAGGSTPSSIIVSKDGVTVGTTTTKINFTGQAVGVTDGGSNTTNVVIGSRFSYFANSLDSPNNSDFAVSAFAATATDPTYTSLNVRSFSNTTEQGVGFVCSIPAGATSMTFKFRGRAQTAPGSASVVQPRLYYRLLPNNSAVGAWSAAQELANINIPTNANFQYATQTVTLATLGLTADRLYQFELTRRVSGVTGTNLAANFLLAEVTVEFQ